MPSQPDDRYVDSMSESYDVAAVRHFQDAQKLSAVGRYDNAGHLIGFAAECAIKYVMNVVEPEDENCRKHLPDLAGIARRRFSGRNPRQVPMLTLLTQAQGGFFHNWQVSYRYSDDGHVTNEQYSAWEKLAKRAISAAHLKA